LATTNKKKKLTFRSHENSTQTRSSRAEPRTEMTKQTEGGKHATKKLPRASQKRGVAKNTEQWRRIKTRTSVNKQRKIILIIMNTLKRNNIFTIHFQRNLGGRKTKIR